MKTIKEKTVLITGGNRGLGLGLVQRFLSKDNYVVATTRKFSSSGNLTELKGLHSQKLLLTELDVSEELSISSWAHNLSHVVEHIDVLINNAAVYGRRLNFTEFTTDDFLMTFKTNAVGPFLVTQQLVRHGLLGPPGSLVVNISSVVSSHGDQAVSSAYGGGYAYRSSKAALNIINKAMSMDLAKDSIECVCIHPGYVQTDMNGGNGWISVEESVKGIVDLLESGKPLNNHFYDYTGSTIPW